MPRVLRRKWAPGKLAFLITKEEASFYAIELGLRAMGSGIDRGTIQRHAAGEQLPRVDTLALYADFFGVPTDFFYEYER